MKKRTLCFLMALCMVMTMVPLSTFAAEYDADLAPAVCTCTGKCSEGEADESCPVCKADYTACTFEAAEETPAELQEEPSLLTGVVPTGTNLLPTSTDVTEPDTNPEKASAYDAVVALFTALPAASSIDSFATQEEIDVLHAQLVGAMDALEALESNEDYQQFMEEHADLLMNAQTLGEALTGWQPVMMAVPAGALTLGSSPAHSEGISSAEDIKNGADGYYWDGADLYMRNLNITSTGEYALNITNSTDCHIYPYGDNSLSVAGAATDVYALRKQAGRLTIHGCGILRVSASSSYSGNGDAYCRGIFGYNLTLQDAKLFVEATADRGSADCVVGSGALAIYSSYIKAHAHCDPNRGSGSNCFIMTAGTSLQGIVIGSNCYIRAQADYCQPAAAQSDISRPFGSRVDDSVTDVYSKESGTSNVDTGTLSVQSGLVILSFDREAINNEPADFPAFTVNFDLNGHTPTSGVTTLVDGQQTYVVPGGALKEPYGMTEQSTDGKLFTGWYTEPTGGVKFVLGTSRVDKNLTLYARWIDPPSGVVINLLKDGQPYRDATVELYSYNASTLQYEKAYDVLFSETLNSFSAEINKAYYKIVINGDTTDTVNYPYMDASGTVYRLPEYYTVTFYDFEGIPSTWVYNKTNYPDRVSPTPQIVKSGALATKPYGNERNGFSLIADSGSTFSWATDTSGLTAFDFTKPITKTTSVYANWKISTEATRSPYASTYQLGAQVTLNTTVAVPGKRVVIVYTTDGTNPFTSPTAKTYTGPITLSETGSCTWKVAQYVEGTGIKSTSYPTFNFNVKSKEATPEPTFENGIVGNLLPGREYRLCYTLYNEYRETKVYPNTDGTIDLRSVNNLGGITITGFFLMSDDRDKKDNSDTVTVSWPMPSGKAPGVPDAAAFHQETGWIDGLTANTTYIFTFDDDAVYEFTSDDDGKYDVAAVTSLLGKAFGTIVTKGTYDGTNNGTANSTPKTLTGTVCGKWSLPDASYSGGMITGLAPGGVYKLFTSETEFVEITADAEGNYAVKNSSALTGKTVMQLTRKGDTAMGKNESPAQTGLSWIMPGTKEATPNGSFAQETGLLTGLESGAQYILTYGGTPAGQVTFTAGADDSYDAAGNEALTGKQLTGLIKVGTFNGTDGTANSETQIIIGTVYGRKGTPNATYNACMITGLTAGETYKLKDSTGKVYTITADADGHYDVRTNIALKDKTIAAIITAGSEAEFTVDSGEQSVNWTMPTVQEALPNAVYDGIDGYINGLGAGKKYIITYGTPAVAKEIIANASGQYDAAGDADLLGSAPLISIYKAGTAVPGSFDSEVKEFGDSPAYVTVLPRENTPDGSYNNCMITGLPAGKTIILTLGGGTQVEITTDAGGSYDVRTNPDLIGKHITTLQTKGDGTNTISSKPQTVNWTMPDSREDTPSAGYDAESGMITGLVPNECYIIDYGTAPDNTQKVIQADAAGEYDAAGDNNLKNETINYIIKQGLTDPAPGTANSLPDNMNQPVKPRAETPNGNYTNGVIESLPQNKTILLTLDDQSIVEITADGEGSFDIRAAEQSTADQLVGRKVVKLQTKGDGSNTINSKPQTVTAPGWVMPTGRETISPAAVFNEETARLSNLMPNASYIIKYSAPTIGQTVITADANGRYDAGLDGVLVGKTLSGIIKQGSETTLNSTEQSLTGTVKERKPVPNGSYGNGAFSGLATGETIILTLEDNSTVEIEVDAEGKYDLNKVSTEDQDKLIGEKVVKLQTKGSGTNSITSDPQILMPGWEMPTGREAAPGGSYDDATGYITGLAAGTYILSYGNPEQTKEITADASGRYEAATDPDLAGKALTGLVKPGNGSTTLNSEKSQLNGTVTPRKPKPAAIYAGGVITGLVAGETYKLFDTEDQPIKEITADASGKYDVRGDSSLTGKTVASLSTKGTASPSVVVESEKQRLNPVWTMPTAPAQTPAAPSYEPANGTLTGLLPGREYIVEYGKIEPYAEKIITAAPNGTYDAAGDSDFAGKPIKGLTLVGLVAGSSNTANSPKLPVSDTTIGYKFIEGAGGNFVQDATEQLGFRANGEYSDFTSHGRQVTVSPLVNNAEGSPSHLRPDVDFTDASGSTIVNLTNDYLSGLPDGTYILRAYYDTNVYAQTVFTVGSQTSGSSGSYTIEYTITAKAGSGGYLFPADTVKVLQGGSTAFTIHCDKGYQIADVMVDGKSIGITDRYEFTNVWADHTISVTFSLIPADKPAEKPVETEKTNEPETSADPASPTVTLPDTPDSEAAKPSAGFPVWILIGAAAVAAGGIFWLLFAKKRKKEEEET